MTINFGILSAATFTSFLVGTILLAVAPNTMEPTEQAPIVPSVSAAPANAGHDPVSDQTIKELEARRSGAFREAQRLSEKVSKMQTSRVEQLEVELARTRRDAQRGNQRIKELEDNRVQSTRAAKTALKELLEELGS